MTINNLLPGVFDTDRIQATLAAQSAKTGQTVEALAQARRQPYRRGGSVMRMSLARSVPSCAVSRPPTSPARTFLADGGAYPGTF